MKSYSTLRKCPTELPNDKPSVATDDDNSNTADKKTESPKVGKSVSPQA